MIGNIIPAINSTNAFFSSCLLNEVIKFFKLKNRNEEDESKEPMIYTYMQLGTQFRIFSLDLEKKNNNCSLCNQQVTYFKKDLKFLLLDL